MGRSPTGLTTPRRTTIAVEIQKGVKNAEGKGEGAAGLLASAIVNEKAGMIGLWLSVIATVMGRMKWWKKSV